jgi:pSer/pThr/pTyr-binding forkhead associated (FHA) protein
MIICPVCQHLNPDDASGCELCGASLSEQQAQHIVADTLNDEASLRLPEGAGDRPAPAPEGKGNGANDGGGLASALLDALEQEKEEGRARGEGPQARSYILRPLPVPDDIPAPSLGAGVPLAGKLRGKAPVTGQPEARVEPTEGEVPCPYCHTPNLPGNRFCGGCGARMPDDVDVVAAAATAEPPRSMPRFEPAPRPAERPGFRVTLVCINEDGSDGARIPLNQPENVLGRASDARFSSDAFLSPRHAKLLVNEEGLFVEDLNSLNGTFVRIREPVRLEPGDCFLMGRQVLRLELFNHEINPKARSTDGTRYMGSPIPTGRHKLLQIGIGGVVQNVYCVPGNGAVLGRERGDITFPGDKFMSAKHAQVSAGDEGELYLSDANSSNGTWIRIARRARLVDQDFIFLGQQLFRVEVRPA